VVYTFANETVLDFISSMPYSGAGGVRVEEPNLEFGDGFFTLDGQFVDMSPGQIYHVWTEVSGVDITYDLTQILPAVEGRFVTLVNVELPENTFLVIQILANGARILSTSGDSPSGEERPSPFPYSDLGKWR
jgi:hypothetical protein